MRRIALVTLVASVVGATALVPALASTRPDDRAGPRCAEASAVVAVGTTGTVRPDDRAGPLGAVVDTQEAAFSPAASHPDNRAGPRGVLPVAEATGTDWTTIASGVAVGAVALLVVAGTVFVTRHGGRHLPHRPAHTH